MGRPAEVQGYTRSRGLSRPADVASIGDRLVDETGEWEVASRPYVTNAGKDAHVRVKKVGQPEVTEIRSWGSHERVSVRRP